MTGTVTVFLAYDRPLENVLSFKYLGRILMATKDDCPVVIANILKTRKSWYGLDWILGRDGADTRTLGGFYIAVVQYILLFGLEKWVVTLRIKQLWGGVPP